MATLDNFREATGEPIQLDLANGYIADIRLNAGDINGRTITVELTDNGTPITDTTGITVALAYNTTPGSGLGDRVSMPAVFGTPTATYRVAVPRWRRSWPCSRRRAAGIRSRWCVPRLRRPWLRRPR